MFRPSFMTLSTCCWQYSLRMAPVSDYIEGFTPPFKMSKRCVNQSNGNFVKKYEIWLKILAPLSTWPKAMVFSG